MSRWLLLVLALPHVASVAAQDTAESGAEEVSEAEIPWELPRALLVRGRRLPQTTARQVAEALTGVLEIVDDATFVRGARARGLPPTSDAAFEALVGDMDLALIVVMERGRIRGGSTLQVTYREGSSGFQLLDEEHPLSGANLTEEIVERLRGEVRLTLAATSRPTGGGETAPSPILESPQRDEDAPPQTPGAVVSVQVEAGAGIGQRSFSLPTPTGVVQLTTSAFPAARVALALDGRPKPSARLSYGGELDYVTSVGLRTTDERLDGTERETPSRSQRLDFALRLGYRFGEPVETPSLRVALGWSLRRFSSEAPVTLPDYSLSGPRLAVGFRLPLLGGRLSFELVPEAHLMVRIGDPLEEQGVGLPALAIGGVGSVRVRIVDALEVRASFRESHALLDNARGSVRDVERYATVSFRYVP